MSKSERKNTPKETTGKTTKKNRKLVLILLLVFLGLPLLGYGLLRSPAVQTYLAKRVAAYLSRELETRVDVGGVNVRFFLNLVLEDLEVEDQSGAGMLYVRRAIVDAGRISLRHRSVILNKIVLDDPYIGLARYPGEEKLNADFLTSYLFSGEREKSGRPWDLVLKAFEIRNASLIYDAHQPARPGPGFDPGYFQLYGLYVYVSDLFTGDDAISFDLERLSFWEMAGFNLSHFTARVQAGNQQLILSNALVRTPGTSIRVDAELNYPDHDAFSDIFNQVEFKLSLLPSVIDLEDLGKTVPGAWGIEGKLNLSGNFTGRVSGFTGSGIRLNYGDNSVFRGDVQFTGLPDFSNTYINLFIDELRTSMSQLDAFRLPLSSGTETLDIPANLMGLGNLSFRGRISGYPSKLDANGTLTSDLGQINARLALDPGLQSGRLSYKGSLSTRGFHLGPLVNDTERIGHIRMDATVDGVGSKIESLAVNITGKVHSLGILGYDYSGIEIEGNLGNRRFNGSLLIEDPNLMLDFLGVIDFAGDIPLFDFNAVLSRANLSRLNLYKRQEDIESVLSARLDINASGSTVDNAQGRALLNDIVYEEHFLLEEGRLPAVYSTSRLSLENSINPDYNEKHLMLRSEYIDADLVGDLHYEWFGRSIKEFLANFIPSFYKDNGPAPGIQNGDINQNFILDVWFKHTATITRLFFPFIELADNSAIRFCFDSATQDLTIEGHSDVLDLFGNRFINWNLEGLRMRQGFQVASTSDRLMISDSLFADRFLLQGYFAADSLIYSANWNTDLPSVKSEGHIEGIARFIDRKTVAIRFLPSFAQVNDNQWRFNPGNRILIGPERIEVENLSFYTRGQLMRLEGVLGPHPTDRMRVTFNNFNFKNLSPIVKVKGMDFDGVLNGSLSFTAVHQPFGIDAGIRIDGFAFNHVHLGDMNIQSVWDAARKGFRIDAEILDDTGASPHRPFLASGYYYPESETDNFDIDIFADRLTLDIWARYLDLFAQNFHGMASGQLRLEGPLAKPGLSGTVQSGDAGFSIGFLNTSYRFNHRVDIGPNYFRFSNLVLVDTLGNSGLANGMIWHDNFTDFEIDINIRPERMIVLNTNSRHSELYYGRAFATGLIHIFGPENDIVMNISARTNRGTQVFLPLVFQGEVAERNFISFVVPDAIAESMAAALPTISGLTLNFDLEVTPDAEVQLIFDSQIGDVIRGRGNGDLKLEITSAGVFNMYGEYIIQEGDYLFTMLNPVNKRFRIEQGGTIRWSGDPNEADINLRALYRLRTSLYDLVATADTSGMYRRRVPVDVVLILRDNLFNPNISFDIQLPGGDENTRELLERLVATEQEMNRQVFSLLVLTRFMPSSADQYNMALGYGVGSTSFEFLSNQVSNWLSQISSDLDIGINYRPGDEISSQEWELALSTQLFNDRVLIDGNLGVAGPNPALQQRASSIIGDVNVEVKLTPEGRFRIKAFNRSNAFDVMNYASPYTQGVGLFYRREFDSLSELFRRRIREPAIPN